MRRSASRPARAIAIASIAAVGLGFGLRAFHELQRRRPSASPAEAREFRSKAANGGDAVLNRCAQCMSFVFGGEIGKTDWYTLYAGSLDDPFAFHPTIASIFAASRPPWAIIPPGFKVFDRLPG